MQVTEKFSEGLKRELEIIVDAKHLDKELSSKLEELKQNVRIKGFRPGKVPVAHLRRVYGDQVMAEVVQKTVHDSIQKTLEDRKERPAFKPEVSLTEDEAELKKIISGQADLAVKLSFEVLPDIEISDFSKLEFEKQVVEVSDEEIDERLGQIANNNVKYTPKDGAAEIDDQVTIDFVGKIDDEPFEGGSAENVPVVIGKNSFIPGFEEGLIGLTNGVDHKINITFPEDYSAEHLAGKDAVFDVKVNEVAAPEEPNIDDEFAKTLGLETLDQLKEKVVEQIKFDHGQVTKMKLKEDVLDQLNEAYSFELPPTLVMQEFDGMWKQTTEDLERKEKTFEDEGTTEDKEREKFYGLAERRVRLGLLLSEIGRTNSIQVNEDELRNAMFERARQFPGQERQVLELFQKNPEFRAQLEGPLFEEKVINLIVENANVTEKQITKEELYKTSSDENDENSESDKS